MTTEEIRTAKKEIHENAKKEIATLEAMPMNQIMAKFQSAQAFEAAKQEIITNARIQIQNLK